MAARSKSRRKARARKRARAGRSPDKAVHKPAASLLATQVELIEVAPDIASRPVPHDVHQAPPVPHHEATGLPPDPLAGSVTTPGAPQPTESSGQMPSKLPVSTRLMEPQVAGLPMEMAEEGPPRAIRILLVEDGNFLRLDIQRALTRAGYAVVTACDGEAGIEAARKAAPDLILLDLLLPKLGGQEVLKILKSDPATAAISVVVLTGLSQKNADRLKADGALAFFEKADLGLEKGGDVLLAALSAIVQKLPAVKGRKRAAAAGAK